MSLKDEIFEILKESKASEKAKSMGLVHKGGGAYGMDKDAPTIAVSTDGGARLAKVDSDEEAEALTKGNNSKSQKSKKEKPEPQQIEKEPKNKEVDITKNDEVEQKDKSLKDIDTLNTSSFQDDPGPSDEEFSKRNVKNQMPGEPFRMPEIKSEKFPKKYSKMLQRMINTKPNKDTAAISYFTNGDAGAGQISAQAGELMTMMFTAMDDDEFKKVSSDILNHVQQQKSFDKKQKQIVDKSWVVAAINNRTAIKQRMKKNYPEGTKLIATCWDTKDEVEDMGLGDYKKDKGFSTDMYAKIQLPDGRNVLDEISLKKSTEVNFLNSGVSKFQVWDPDLSDDLKMERYVEGQRNRLKNTVAKYKDDVQNLIDSGKAKELQSVMKSKKINSIEDALNAKGSRGNSKVLMNAMETLATNGNDKAASILEKHKQASYEFASKSVNEVTSNEKLKNGMLEEIRSEFPLKAVSEGEETMAIGPLSLDKNTMKDIFGTDDYDEIKEKLVAVDEEPPYIGYKADVKGDVIPIAEIVIREDGVGYGGQFKFEMKLDKRFAKVLKQSHDDVYNKVQESIKVINKYINESIKRYLGV